MAKQSLAIKYRPSTFDDVTEQGAIKIILEQQIRTQSTKNAYLFCGSAGTGKTTCARIFANELNKGVGNPIEMDAASNSGVDDVRLIIQQAKTRPIVGEYKIFIIDECHSISNTGWQAFLKLLEEPPTYAIFIFCTTDPQKIPKTILSRVQRYDFQRISREGIVERLIYILTKEQELGHDEKDAILYEDDALEYIAKIADGGMRDAITMIDKCLSYSTHLSMVNVLTALGSVDYSNMIQLTEALVVQYNPSKAVAIIEDIYSQGKDLKQFIKQFMVFILDVCKYQTKCDWRYIGLPKTTEIEQFLIEVSATNNNVINTLRLLGDIIQLDSDVKYSQTVKYDFQAMIMTRQL